MQSTDLNPNPTPLGDTTGLSDCPVLVVGWDQIPAPRLQNVVGMPATRREEAVIAAD